MTDIYYTDEFGAWFDGLDMPEKEDIDFVVGLLGEMGLTLGYPHSSSLRGARYAFRELRPRQGKSPLRVVMLLTHGETQS